MNRLLLWLMGVSFLSASAQIRFEPGHYISNDGRKVEGLIKNSDWMLNPQSIFFKTAAEAPETEIPMSQMRGFDIGTTHKYRRFDLQLDASPESISQLSESAQPEWQKTTAMIRIVAEGPYNLYYYRSNAITRFYYSTGTHEAVEPLVYKAYQIQPPTIHYNFAFRQQLLKLFATAGLPVLEASKLEYKQKQLSALFVKYAGATDITIDRNSKRYDGFRFHVGFGAALQRLELENTYIEEAYVFKGTSMLPEIELEYALNFNRGKWSIFLAPNYKSLKSQGTQGDYDYTADVKMLTIPLGLRYSMFPTADTRIFVDGSVGFFKNFKSELTRDTFHYSVDDNYALMVGVGAQWKRLSVRLRLETAANMLKYTYTSARYRTTELTLRYRVL